MSGALLDPHDQLDTIRGLMERAREYRHPPATVGFVAGSYAALAGIITQRMLETTQTPALGELGLLWGAVFAVAFAAVVFFTSRAAKQEGKRFWSPLAKDVILALAPSLVAAVALTIALVRAGHLELVAPLWLLAYGTGGIAAGAFASPIVRRLGVAFLAAGLAQLVLELPSGYVLAATFGGFHIIYGGSLVITERNA